MKYEIEAKSVGADSKIALFTIIDGLDSVEIEVQSNNNKVAVDKEVFIRVLQVLKLKDKLC